MPSCQQWGGFPFHYIHSAFIVCRFFDDSHSDWCEVIPPCSFDLHFSNKWYWASFRCLFAISMSSLRNVCLGLLPKHFLFGLFVFLILSYIFWRLILCQLLHLQLFSPILRVLILFIVFFAVQKLLSLIRFHLFIFIFISITLGDGSKRILLWLMSKSVLLIFL